MADLFMRSEPCTCCGRPKPASWDDLIDDLDEAILSRNINVSLISTGGGCNAICLQPHGISDHVLLTTGGTLMSDRQADLAATVEELACTEADPGPDGWKAGHFPTWECGFYNGDGEQVAIVNLSTTCHPDHDEATASEVAGLLRTAGRVRGF